MLHIDTSKLKIKDFSSIKKKLDKIKGMPIPDFNNYVEDVQLLKKTLKKYRWFKNLIVIGNGGSNTSFLAYHKALVPLDSKKKAFILTSMEPDLIKELRSTYSRSKTLVMPISKSGTNIGILEAMFAFSDYKLLPVTSPEKGALSVIAEEKKMEMIPHPPIGGRYSGFTASAFAPALFFGIDVEDIQDGAKTMYDFCNPKVHIDRNPALQLAASLYLLEKKGYIEIFCPIYSSKLSGFQNLIVQLMHESVCKKGKGQTSYCAEAPESQHHTNQRFFGGRKNVLGLFITVDKQNDCKTKVNVPVSVSKIKVRDGILADIDNTPYASALEYEFQGTYQDAVNKKIPCAHIHIDKVSPFDIGELTAFWHYVAVYSAALRDVDPFDQPQVESSKDISFKLRKEHQKNTKKQ